MRMNHAHFHRRNLPHIYLPGRTYFITFRLKGSLPKHIIENLRSKADFKSVFQSVRYEENRKFLKEYDDKLNSAVYGPVYLKNSKVAQIVKDTLKYYDNKDYSLICYCVMPNHVHVLFSLLNNSGNISKIMQSIKRYSAEKANKILNREGSFWQPESYDHIVREENEYYRIVKYILNNPVKAGLVEKWEDYEHNYLNL